MAVQYAVKQEHRENNMALKDIADKIKKKLKGEDAPEDTTFPKALKSDRTYRSTYGEYKYPITDRQGRPELLDVEESKKRGYPATSDDRLIGARGVVTEYKEDFPNMRRSKEDTDMEAKQDAILRKQDAAWDKIKKGEARAPVGEKKGGAIKAKKMASGGKVAQLAKANGIAVKGKSRGRIV